IFTELIDKYSKEEKIRIKLAESKVDEIESFLKSSKKVVVSEKLKLEAVELALKKHPPFHLNKNNFGDALILLSTTDYIAKNNYVLFDTIFVSDNYKDYCTSSTSTEIHPEIKTLLPTNVRLNFTRNIGEAL